MAGRKTLQSAYIWRSCYVQRHELATCTIQEYPSLVNRTRRHSKLFLSQKVYKKMSNMPTRRASPLSEQRALNKHYQKTNKRFITACFAGSRRFCSSHPSQGHYPPPAINRQDREGRDLQHNPGVCSPQGS